MWLVMQALRRLDGMTLVCVPRAFCLRWPDTADFKYRFGGYGETGWRGGWRGGLVRWPEPCLSPEMVFACAGDGMRMEGKRGLRGQEANRSWRSEVWGDREDAGSSDGAALS